MEFVVNPWTRHREIVECGKCIVSGPISQPIFWVIEIIGKQPNGRVDKVAA
jgi:hypothetical protein